MNARHTASPAFIMVSVEDIARRAYEMYLERGRIDGLDRDDWRRAEIELKHRTPDTGETGHDPIRLTMRHV